MALNHEDRTAAMLARSSASMRNIAITGVNTAANQMDFLIPAPAAGYRIALWKISGPAVTNAASTAVCTFLTGGTTVATNTTVVGRKAAALTVTAAWTLPLVTSAQPAAGTPLAMGEDSKALHLHMVSTSADAGTAEATYSVVKELSNPLSA